MDKTDGGPAFKGCRTCHISFLPKAWQLRKHDYECARCKSARQNDANANDINFKEKRRRRNQLPKVKAANHRYWVTTKNNSTFRLRRRARRAA